MLSFSGVGVLISIEIVSPVWTIGAEKFTCGQTMTYRFATIQTDLVLDNSDEDRFDINSFRHLHVIIYSPPIEKRQCFFEEQVGSKSVPTTVGLTF